MNSEPKDKYYGTPLSQVIAEIPGELPLDAVGLFQIVPKGRDGFGFTGALLTNFVSRAVRALLDAGAVPVRGGPGSGYTWIAQKQYGTLPDDIVANVIAEWLSMPDDPLVLCGEGVWFARPQPGTKYVKLE